MAWLGVDSCVQYIKDLWHPFKGKGVARRSEIVEPREQVLPPLTSNAEVDVQLYAIISVILSQFVQTWYNKITSDATFVEEVINVISHCTLEVEQRLKNVDLETLLLDELPSLLNDHIEGESKEFAMAARAK